MPFTFSHPAITLPFKRWFSTTGLVVGSMSPDFEYFLKMNLENQHGHTFAGIFYFDLMISLVLCFLYHNIIRDALIRNLPSFLNSRFNYVIDFSWNDYFRKNWFLIMLSIIIGAFSHIFWDSFTHDTGFFVEKIPFLQEVLKVGSFRIPVFKILQHGSTFVGAMIIIFYIFKKPLGKSNSMFFNAGFWFPAFVVSIIVILVRLSYLSFNLGVGNLIVTIIPSLFVGVLFSSLLNLKRTTN